MSALGLNPLDAAISQANNSNFGLNPTSVNPTGAPQAPNTPSPATTPTDPAIADQVTKLNADEPSRYVAMSPDDYVAFQKKQQDEDNQPQGFIAGFENAIGSGNVRSAGYAAKGISQLINSGGLFDAGDRLIDVSDRIAPKGKAPTLDSVLHAGSASGVVSKAWDYLKYQLGSAAGGAALPIAGATAGGAAASATLGPEAAPFGAVAGLIGTTGIPAYGDVYEQLTESPGVAEQVKAGKVSPKQLAAIPIVPAAVMSAIYSTGLEAALGKALVGKISGSITKRIVQGATTGALFLGGASGIQEAIKQGVADAMGDDTPMSQRVQSIVDATVGGVLGGGVFGGVTHGLGGDHADQNAAPDQGATASAPGGGDGAPQAPAAAAPGYDPGTVIRVNAPGTPNHGRDAEVLKPVANGYSVLFPDGREGFVDRLAARPAPLPGETTPTPAAEPMPGAGEPTPKPSSGPLGRALDAGDAHQAAQAAHDTLPPGSRVAVSMGGSPPMEVTVAGYHPNGMDVIDANGEQHTLPMDDPDMQIAPIAKAPPAHIATVPEPVEAPKAKASETNSASDLSEMGGGMGKGIASGMYDGLWARVQQGIATEAGAPSALLQAAKMVRDAGGLQTRDEFEKFAGEYAAINRGPGFQTDMRSLVAKWSPAPAATAPKNIDIKAPTGPAPKQPDQPRSVPINANVAGTNVVFPDQPHALLYSIGRRRQSLRTAGRDTAAADKLILNERQKAADALHMPLDAVNQAADDYRYTVETGAKKAAGDQYQAPTVPEGVDSNPTWDSLPIEQRAAIFKQAGVSWNPKFKWGVLSEPIRTKVAPIIDGLKTDAAAHEAATSPTNELPEPTQAQKEAGNYPKGHLKVGQLDISVENPQGSERSGVGPDGKPWSNEMQSHYGYIRGTVGIDKDHVDAFVKPGTPADWNGNVYVVDQNKRSGRFDEHKSMVGFDSADEARQAYLANYGDGQEKNIRGITEMPLDKFNEWAKSDAPKKGPLTSDAQEDRLFRAFDQSPRMQAFRRAADAAREADKEPESEKANGPEAEAKPGPGAKWFGSRDKADRYVEKQGIGDTHEVVPAGRRFEIREKADVSDEERSDTLSDDQVNEIAQGRGFAKWVHQKVGGVWEVRARRNVAPASPRTEVVITRKQFDDLRRQYAEEVTAPQAKETPAVQEETARPAPENAAEITAQTEVPKGHVRLYRGERKGSAPQFPGDVHTGGWFTTDQKQAVEYGKVGYVDVPKDELRKNFGRGSGGLGNKVYLTDDPKYRAALKPLPADAVSQAEAPKPTGLGQKSDYGAKNKLVTVARADEIRAKLREKLKGQLSAGIDPEILAMGTELAAFHIEAGARKFADAARAIAGDLGVSVATIRKYMRAWYNGARDLMEDSGHDVSGMDTPETVRAQAPVLGDVENGDEPAKLGGASQGSLEGVPAKPVQGAASEREAGRGGAAGGAEHVPGHDRPDGQERNEPSGRLGSDEGAVSVPARGGERASGRARSELQGGRDAEHGGGDEQWRTDDQHAAADRLEQQVTKKEPAPKSAAEPASERSGNYVITDKDALGEGGQRAKYRDNLNAIRLLKQIEGERRDATRDEQAQLAKYVGWGGLAAAFPREDGSVAKGWEDASKELRELLTPEEYKAAAASTRNAHYTSPEVVNEMWRAVRRLGFGGGRVLEPSVGVGNFLGLMPGEARDGSQITGVELDRVTGGIAKLLYPHANIQAPIGFQEFDAPRGYFDLAIGNPPFGSERLYDANNKHLNFSIHNFFFAKSLDSLRDGGVLAMVVSNSLMDAHNTGAREYLGARADLIGAIRLPNDAFRQNAGTDVTTDIIFLRKRGENGIPFGPQWLKVRNYKDADGRAVPLNEYFHANPDNMLGKFGGYGEMYREGMPALIPNEGQNTAKLLHEAINRLPERIIEAAGVPVEEPEVRVPREATDALVGSMFLDSDGKLWLRDPDFLGQPKASLAALDGERVLQRVSGMVRLRDAFSRLRAAQLDATATDKQIENLRDRLNKSYDGFVAKNGYVNLDANRRVFIDDPTWPQISALEEKFDRGLSETVAGKTGEKAREPSAEKAAIFTKRTQHPYQRPTSAKSAKDALSISQSELGRLDLDYMAQLYGKTPDAIVDELGDLIYKNPEAGYEPHDAYLSGNVKRKLALAIEAAKTDPALRRNVAALREVIPPDLNPADIEVAPGSHWIPPEHIAAFADHIGGGEGAQAIYSPANARWIIKNFRSSGPSETQWGTDRASVKQVLEAALHGATITIRDKLSDGTSVINQLATDAANEKINAVADQWRRWIWQDDARRKELAGIYNDTFNTDRLREFDGSHLTLPGKVSDDVIELRPHQKNYVWRELQSPTTLADHVVGAGKTFAKIAATMEKRRTGMAKKPMIVVPNHLVSQWAADFVRLYPAAKVLAAGKKDFEANNRKRLFARVATGDWDAVIVPHSSFGKIPVDPEFHKRFIEDQVADIEQSIATLREADGKGSRTVKQLEKWRDNQKNKLEKLLAAGDKDVGLTFQDLGIDDLSVDEAHEFKNLGFSTSMNRVAGLGNQMGSQKAADLYMKISSLLEKTGGRNVQFATGTPISNTMAEMFTMQRYMQPRALKELGLSHFDAWARMFGKVVTDWELSPAGKYRLNSRFAKFVNMPELLRQYRSFADVITRDDIERQLVAQGKTLGVPKMIGDKPQLVVVDRSQAQAQYTGLPIKDKDGNETGGYPEGSLIWRAENLPRDPREDNMLKIMSDARKSALDMRMIDPSHADVPGSKINRAADNIANIHRQWEADKGAQLVFIDLSTPKAAKGKEVEALRALVKAAEDGDESAQSKLDAMSPDEFEALNSKFSVYDDLRQKLLDRGIPPNEIAFIHDANTDKQKEELFGKVRSGQVRVLMGSTAKMGAGMNVQERLVALHHIDAPWRPSDLEQREGRIIRQGNVLYARDPENFRVGVYRYATKQTLDARMWQTIEGKARFIEQLRKGDLTQREVEDIGGEAANAAEMKAAASGNPLILEEMDLRQQVRKLDSQRTNHDREQFRIKQDVESAQRGIERLQESLPKAKADAEKAQAIPTGFKVELHGKDYDRPKEAGARILLDAAEMMYSGQDQREIGTLGGFKLFLEPVHGSHFVVEVGAEHPYQIAIDDTKTADATGTAMRIANGIRKLVTRPEAMQAALDHYTETLPKLQDQIKPWSKEAEFEQARARHRQVIAQLQPKKAPDAKAAGAAPEGDDEAHSRIGDAQRIEPALTERAKQSRPDLEAAVRSAIERVAGKDAAERTQMVGAIDDKPGPNVSADWNDTSADHTIVGQYYPGRETSGVFPLIRIALSHAVDAVRAGYHEGWHSVEGTLTPDELAILRRATPRLRELVARRMPDVADIVRGAEPEEIWAEAAAIHSITRDRGGLPGAPGLLRDVFNKIGRVVEAVRNAVKGLGFRTAEDVFSDFGRGEMAERRGSLPNEMRNRWWKKTGAEPQSAIAAKTGAKDEEKDGAFPRTARELGQRVKALAEDQRQRALSLLPLNTLSDWAAKGQSAVKGYIDLKRDMDAFRNQKQVDADNVVTRWRKVMGVGGKNSRALADLMHESTLAGIDPTKGDRETRAKPGYAAVKAKYDALSPAARAIYSEVRDAYKANADQLDKILLDNIGKAMDLQGLDIERRHQEALDQIRDLGLKGEERADALDTAERNRVSAMGKLKFSKAARLAAIRASFEANRVPEPYFRLARFGDYFANVRDEDGKVLSFSKRESKAQLDQLVRQLKAAYPEEKIETGVMSNKAEVRDAMDPRFVADVVNMLGGANVSDEVMDQVWQRYLESMPDLSIRKQFIHRRGVPGFHEDALRSFASQMFHMAHQMARVKYGGDLGELVNKATDQAKLAAPADTIAAMKLANELRLRHDWVMNPTNADWATAINQLGFIYYLGLSPASAIVNLTQTAILGVPILGTKFGAGRTMAALARASKEFVAGKGTVERGNLTPEEKAGIDEGYRRGTLDRTQALDLSGVSASGASYNPTRTRVMRTISYLFHHTERFNRETTYLAAYRLARNAGEGHEQAIDTASDLTWKTHFDYSNTNRPRVMQGDVAKVLLQFKNFQLNMLYRLFRDTHQSFAGDTPEARKEARTQLAGIVGMLGLSAGALGVPLMKQVMIPLYGAIFGNPDDDKSWKEEFRDGVLNTLGPQLGGMALDGVPGYLAGVSLTNRIGMGDLWFQDQDRVENANDWWTDMTNQVLGPAWGMAHNFYNGFNVMRDGKGVARGIEMMMPTELSHVMKSFRYAQNGVVNLRGDQVVPQDDIGLGGALKQAIGFTPAEVTEQYDRNTEKTNMQKRMQDARKGLLDGYSRAVQSGDEAAIQSALAEIERFNKVPGHEADRITGETMRESIHTRARLTNRAENGVIIQNRRLNSDLNDKLPPRVY